MTLAIRLQFVTILRTPCLLAMFSKDPISAAYAQSGLRSMALLEPHFVMPELLERAYDGLEAVIETHRTTAVLGMLTGMVRPLVCENVWLGGQKHVVPLLMGTLAGIDLVHAPRIHVSHRLISTVLPVERSCEDDLRDAIHYWGCATYQDWRPIWETSCDG